MNEEAAFHRALHENEDDATPTLVYADWVEEHGKPTVAEVMRRHSNNLQSGAYDQNTSLSPEQSPVRHIKPGKYRAVAMSDTHDASNAYMIVLQQKSLVHNSGENHRHFIYSLQGLGENELNRITDGLHNEGVDVVDFTNRRGRSHQGRSLYKRLAQATAYTRKRSGK